MVDFAEFRKKAGFTQEKAARKINVSTRTVSRWECGEDYPSFQNLQKIAKVYGLSAKEKLLLMEHSVDPHEDYKERA